MLVADWCEMMGYPPLSTLHYTTETIRATTKRMGEMSGGNNLHVLISIRKFAGRKIAIIVILLVREHA